jgi:hypothetical protein
VPDKSTYSKLMVIKQLCKTCEVIPSYLSSNVSNNLDNGRGAGSASESLDVKVLAEAKYRRLKWPTGALDAVSMQYLLSLMCLDNVPFISFLLACYDDCAMRPEVVKSEILVVNIKKPLKVVLR